MNSHSLPLTGHREHGMGENLRSMLRAVSLYAEARLRLVLLESKEVLHIGLLVAGLAIFSVVAMVIAYAGTVVAATLWIARTWWGGDMLPAVMIVTGGHLLLAGCCAGIIACATRGKSFFHATIKEFKEDKQWLHNNPPSRN